MEALESVRKIAALPPEAQAMIFDLIDAMEKRYPSAKTKAKLGSQMAGLREDPFIGMWRKRDDMGDPAQYVHKLRRTEWKRHAKNT